MKLTQLFLTLGLAAGCKTSQQPASCKNLEGIRAASIREANGEMRIHYTYADEAMRIPHLHCRADLGERSAMVELGQLYEYGLGVERNEQRAASLYAEAADDRPNYTSIYSPAVRLGGTGQVMLVPNPGGGPGDAEAKYRLGHMLIEGRGVPKDAERGQALIDAAVNQGFPGKKPD
ncbi:hypothetical protein L6Q21_14190 [Sandaracinobacter sp. RS1-74]|uniref:hypothetical protein n=1 Tax=Sandaracinobacteroides sayramensis TaxID=2913411 RepID=UPI001EDAF2ED|nr:hypothetical protein [Sandaracinobacteroides sayramensis]MCG2842135.1 hypothetical protein [Sandaracinobacteroides sayramensis]